MLGGLIGSTSASEVNFVMLMLTPSPTFRRTMTPSYLANPGKNMLSDSETLRRIYAVCAISVMKIVGLWRFTHTATRSMNRVFSITVPGMALQRRRLTQVLFI